MTKTGTSPSFAAAIDVGGTKIASALFTREGEISAREKAAIDKAGGDAAAAQVAGRIGPLAAAAAIGRRTAGRRRDLASPASPIPASGKVWAPNIPGWDQYPLLDKIRGLCIRASVSPSFSKATGAPMSPASPGAGPRPGPRTSSSWPSGRASAPASSPAAGSSTATRTSPAPSAGSRLDPAFKPEYAAMGCFEAEASGEFGRPQGPARGSRRAGRPVHARPRRRDASRPSRPRSSPPPPGPRIPWPWRSSPRP